MQRAAKAPSKAQKVQKKQQKQPKRKIATKAAVKKVTPVKTQSTRKFSADAIASPQFQPTSNRILVKKDAVEKPKTAGGILLPQSQAKNTNPLATVVAVGPGLRNNEGKFVPTFTRVGDKVVLPDFGGAELKFNNEAFHLYRDDDVLGVVGNMDVASRVNAV